MGWIKNYLRPDGAHDAIGLTGPEGAAPRQDPQAAAPTTDAPGWPYAVWFKGNSYLFCHATDGDDCLSLEAACGLLNRCIEKLRGGAPSQGRNLATEITLCQHSHAEAVDGACPVHGGDACLRQYAPVRSPTAEGPPPSEVTK